jgi:hypothetical protein
MDLKPLHFFDEPIIPAFDIAPSMEKKQGCPDGFIWRNTDYRVVELVKEWHDYSRKGRMARNMQPQHAIVASNRGSWGVGRDYYIVKVDTGRYFQIYYDRAPKDVDHRKGDWFLWGELTLQ